MSAPENPSSRGGSQPFLCPSSGQMLGFAVRAFNLGQSEVGGQAAARLGNGNAGKTARNYFDGAWTPDATRMEVCHATVRVVRTGLLPQVPLSPPQDAGTLDDLLSESLMGWLETWDRVFETPTRAWPRAHQPLARFVLGRQLLIDLALRAVGFCHLAGITSASLLAISGDIEYAGRRILHGAMDKAGTRLTDETLEKRLRSCGKKAPDLRTVQRWMQKNAARPNDQNLRAIARVLSPDGAEPLLRWLRWQYGVLGLERKTRSALGPRLSEMLFDGLRTFLESGLLLMAWMRRDTQGNEEIADVPQASAWDLVLNGIGATVSRMWLEGWLVTADRFVWRDDLQFAIAGAVQERIVACLKEIGDWPRLETSVKQHMAKQGMEAELSQDMFETVAIWSMNDNTFDANAQELAAHPESFVYRVTGDDRLKAANRAAQGKSAMDRGDFDAAIPHWTRAAHLADDPRHKSNALFHLGVCLWRASSHRFEDAVAALEESFRLWPVDDPQRDRPFVEIAIIYQNRGWFDHALQHLDSDPAGFATTSGHFNFVRGRTLHVMNRWGEALESLERAIEFGTERVGEAHAYAADSAFEICRQGPDRSLKGRARNHAKNALHMGSGWAHDKWLAG